MALHDLTERIKKDARETANRIKSGAVSTAQEIESKAEAERLSIQEKHKSNLETLLSENVRKVKANASLEVKMQIENIKRSLVDEAFSKAEVLFSQLPDKEYEEILKKLVVSIPQKTEGDVILPSSRKAITLQVLKDAGISVSSVIEGDMKAGFILTSPDFEYVMTVENLFRRLKEKNEIAVAEILFG
ncbi:MAG: hypothetical protein COV70_03680 [Parcubacteria group bacterium CG11_big_fil_rev_8_21_14_0_20_39_22]|nr:MAG: hypothetical protein COV70_03680 [Parcubacteria group bacterium CG11_big_fil_rev_8_21_14_0_20_39_22]